VAERIGQSTGRRVTLATRVDPDILGGIVVRVGNSILDASIRSRLELLRRQVAHGA
jgi:F-type H+-transporting ATPase subunit delta